MEVEHKQGEAARLAAIARVAITRGLGGDAARLREALEELGPTFVKFGQMISQREDLFPAPLVAELRSLQDRAGTFPAAQARQIIEQDTKSPVSGAYGPEVGKAVTPGAAAL